MTPLDAAQPAKLAIDLNRAVLALSDALDFTGIDEISHGHRVALMAANCARALGWDDEAIHRITLAGLLHDCGVSSTREHRHLVDEIVWEGERAHCERGFDFLGKVPSLAYLAPMVLEHHTPWPDLVRRGVVAEVAVPANLICLCDRADAVRARGVAEGKPVIDVLDRYADKHFSPALMAVFREEARREAFWFAQEDPTLRDTIAHLVGLGPAITLGMVEIKALAVMFGHIIDAKSPFTERHSLGVAKVARHLAGHFGASAEILDVIEIAGLLHDLGKLRIPDELLEKHGPLSADERRRMARHAFDTYQILLRVFGDGPIAQWAAFHHEYVSGQGYPFHLEGVELPRQARIIAVADVLQALAQKRPYRQPLATEEIASILDGMVFGGKLDRDVVEVVKADLPLYWRDAVANEGVDGSA
jgi:HD-GYP domain-containing protein (c-di-GMP phosphodiesterase class II)